MVVSGTSHKLKEQLGRSQSHEYRRPGNKLLTEGTVRKKPTSGIEKAGVQAINRRSSQERANVRNREGQDKSHKQKEQPYRKKPTSGIEKAMVQATNRECQSTILRKGKMVKQNCRKLRRHPEVERRLLRNK